MQTQNFNFLISSSFFPGFISSSRVLRARGPSECAPDPVQVLGQLAQLVQIPTSGPRQGVLRGENCYLLRMAGLDCTSKNPHPRGQGFDTTNFFR